MDESGMQFFWTGVIFWSFLGAIVSALIMQGKTKDQGKIFVYVILGFFSGYFWHSFGTCSPSSSRNPCG